MSQSKYPTTGPHCSETPQIHVRFRCPDWLRRRKVDPQYRLTQHRADCEKCRDTWIYRWVPVPDLSLDLEKTPNVPA